MKILLITYLVSIIYYFLGFILLGATIRSGVKKEGIKVQKYPFAELALAWARIIIIGLIPIINIIVGTIYIFSDKVKEVAIKKALERKI